MGLVVKTKGEIVFFDQTNVIRDQIKQNFSVSVFMHLGIDSTTVKKRNKGIVKVLLFNSILGDEVHALVDGKIRTNSVVQGSHCQWCYDVVRLVVEVVFPLDVFVFLDCKTGGLWPEAVDV
jgi:hypothetical protein